MKTIECPQCEGKGNFPSISDCCGADREPDLGLCYECHDHCDPAECFECHGSGEVEVDTHLFDSGEVIDMFLNGGKI